ARAGGGSSRANAAAAQEEGKQSASRDAVRRAQAASALESRAADASSGSGEAPRGVAVSLPRTPQEWRSALVLNEILSRPLAERDPTGEF
ncbi:MAG TPA: hypothetical protein PKL78_04445, partial [Anaerolineales bacterium]|nr:hypothetical protein [Anaerolineales bacterium]